MKSKPLLRFTGADALPASTSHRAKGSVRASLRSRWRAAALIVVHLAVLVHLAQWKVGGSTLTPLEPSEAMQTFELGLVNAGFVLLAVATLATLVVGRFFCGWLCHVVAYQDLCAWLLRRLGIEARPLRARMLAFVPLGVAFYMFAWPRLSGWIGGRTFPALQAHFTTESFWATFPGPGIALLTIAIDGFLIVYLLGGKAFCTYGCPYGAIFGLAERVAPGRIRVSDACNGCGHCTATCTSNVRVHEEVARYKQVVDAGCMKCLDCVSVCPTNALSFGFGESRNASLRRALSKPKKHYDFSWGEELGATLAFGVGLYAFRGLYDAIPLLLAVGLAVILAVLVVALRRLAKSSQRFAFQSSILRENARLTGRGWSFAAIGAACIALTMHSGWVQFDAHEGDRWLAAAGKLAGPERASAISRSLVHLARAERIGFVTSGKLELKLGSIAREQGQVDEARQRFRRAIEVDPSLRAPRLALADLLIIGGELAQAEAVLVALLELDPSNVDGSRRLVALRNARAASGQ